MIKEIIKFVTVHQNKKTAILGRDTTKSLLSCR